MNKVSEEQLGILADNGTITKGDDTLTADEGAAYLTPDTSVSYAAQTLTTEQKTQARTNIGAGTSNFSGSYTDLTDKPTIPTVNDGVLTIQKEGTTLDTFSANNSSNKTINIVETDPVFSASAAAGILNTDISNWNNKVDKTTDSNKVYGTDSNGNQTTYETSVGGIAQGKVPIYGSNGCLHTLTPYFSYDAVNKGYVDNFSNPNLLINGNFRVNQRSQASYSAVGYTVDRWRMSGTIRTVTPIDAGLQISGGLAGGTTFLTQRLEDTPKMWGKTFSISMTMTDGSFISSTFTLPSSAPSEDADYGATDTLIDLGLRIRLHYYSSSGLLAFVIDCQNTVQDYIEYVKLEIGSIATPFSPRTYAEELALCQRYYQTALYEFSFFAQTTSLGYGHINLPVTMRTLPTATFPTGYIHGGDGYLGNPTSIRIEGSLKSNAIRFAIGQTFVQNRLYMLESSNLIELDAELY